MQVVYNRDALPAGQSQNQLEEAAILAVVRVLPLGVAPVVLADGGFARATFLTWLEQQGLDYVIALIGAPSSARREWAVRRPVSLTANTTGK